MEIDQKPPKKDPRGGHNAKYTKALAKKIVALVSKGLSKDSAAECEGISTATLYRWQADRPEFAAMLSRARGDCKKTLIEVIHSAASQGDGRLALEFASRLWPDEFSRRQTTIVEGNPEKPLDVTVRLSEERAEIARRLAGMTTDELLSVATHTKAALEERRVIEERDQDAGAT